MSSERYSQSEEILIRVLGECHGRCTKNEILSRCIHVASNEGSSFLFNRGRSMKQIIAELASQGLIIVTGISDEGHGEQTFITPTPRLQEHLSQLQGALSG